MWCETKIFGTYRINYYIQYIEKVYIFSIMVVYYGKVNKKNW